MGYVGAILKDNKGKMLFQLRDEKGKNPNKWGIFGGGIKKGESSVDAIIRELKEELGLHITNKDIYKKHRIPLVDYHIFIVDLKHIPNKSELKEGKDMRFMDKKEFFKTKNGLLRIKIFLKFFNTT